MDYVIDLGFGTQQYILDDHAFTINAHSKVIQKQIVIPWDSIIAAGYSPRTLDDSGETQQIADMAEDGLLPPGGGWLMNKGIDINTTTDWLLIAYKPEGKGRKLHYAHVWKDAPETQEFINVLRTRLGDRWHDEPLDAVKFRSEMKVSSWWVVPMGLILMLGVCAAILGWAYITEEFWYWVLGATVITAALGWLARRGTISLPWQP